MAAHAPLAAPSPWVLRFAPLMPAGEALDLACGSGRHVRLLAALGHPVLAVDRDPQALAAAMHRFEQDGKLEITAAQRARAADIFLAERVDEHRMMQAISWAHTECAQVIDPHTAIALAAARSRADDMPPGAIVTLATAHPAKFPEAVERACGVRPPLPRRLQHLFDREESLHRLPNDASALKSFIRDRA